MLQIDKAETKFWYLTLGEKTTILNPYYLFSLKHRLTAVTYNFILTDSSSYTDRYNKFEITEGSTITLDAGEYEYKIYAQTSDTNTDPALANELVERGIVKVDFDPTAATQYTVELNEKIYEIEAPEAIAYLLLESGDFLLQEDNTSKILL
jgi:hypothetical protein